MRKWVLFLSYFAVIICMEQENNIEQENNTQKMNFFVALGKHDCIYYALPVQIKLFARLHLIDEKTIPDYTPFIQVHTYHESIDLKELPKNRKDTFYDWLQVYASDKWLSVVIGFPLYYFDNPSFCISTKYDGKKYQMTYKICSGKIGIPLHEKIEAFRKNPLRILEGKDLNNAIIKSYIDTLLESDIIVQKGKRYCHGPGSYFAQKERAAYNQVMQQRIINFLSKSDETILMLLSYEREKGADNEKSVINNDG